MSAMFASRIKKLKVSGIREIFNLANSMTDCVNLSIGQPDFDVPPQLKQAAKQAIEDGFNRYTVTGGIPELRSGILRHIHSQCGVRPEAAIVTSGVSGGLVLSFMGMIEEGDEVLIPDPHFVLYKSLVELYGGVPVLYDTYPDFKPHRAELISKITKRTKLLMINSPQNPTGVCYDREDLSMLAEVAAENDLLVISDEIYRCFSYDSPPLSMLQFYPKTLLLSGFSKCFAMPGWRMGYMAGPAEIVDTLETLQQHTFVCAPAPFQKACAAWIDCDVSRQVADYRRKRDFVYDGLRENFDLVKPSGAFYMFVKVPCPGVTGTEFVKEMLKQKLLLVPGCTFSSRDTHFRLSFAAKDEDLARGIELLNEVVVQCF